MVFFMFVLGCQDETTIKEEIVVIETVKENSDSKSNSSKEKLWVPEVSNDPQTIKQFQVMVGGRLQMPVEMQKKLEVYTPGNRCTIVRDPMTKMCVSIFKKEDTWEIQQMGMKLDSPQYTTGICYFQNNTMDDIAKDDQAFRGFMGIVEQYCNGN